MEIEMTLIDLTEKNGSPVLILPYLKFKKLQM